MSGPSLSILDVAVRRGAPSSTYTLIAAVGAFVLSGDAMTPEVDYVLPADVGLFVEIGVAAGLVAARTLSVAAGSCALTGQDATLTYTPVASGFALIANTSGTGTFNTSAVSSAIDTTGANLLVVSVSQYNGDTIGTLTDSKSNTWTALTVKGMATSEEYARIFYCASPSVGSGHTFTYSGHYGVVGVQAWSGAHASPFDVQNGFENTSGATSVQPGSVTPSQDNSLIITAGSFSHETGYSINGGYTITANVDYNSGGGTNEGLCMAYLVQGAAAATNPTLSIASGTGDVAAVVAVFKPA